IYLHKLDEFVDKTLVPEYTRGRLRAKNPEYRKVEQAIVTARRKGDRAQVRALYRGLLAVLAYFGFDLPDVLVDLVTVVAPNHHRELTRRGLVGEAGQLGVTIRFHSCLILAKDDCGEGNFTGGYKRAGSGSRPVTGTLLLAGCSGGPLRRSRGHRLPHPGP